MTGAWENCIFLFIEKDNSDEGCQANTLVTAFEIHLLQNQLNIQLFPLNLSGVPHSGVSSIEDVSICGVS